MKSPSALLLVFCCLLGCQQSRNDKCTDCATPEAFPGQTGISKTIEIDGNKIHYYEIAGQAVWEGDIILAPAQLRKVKENALTGAAILGRRWPGGVVHYKIDSSLPNQARVTDAIRNWEEHTNVTFILAGNSDANYILFTTGSGCSSSIGMVGGEQKVHLSTGCTVGNAVHEIGHVLGLFHEISRADRDVSITIQWANIKAGHKGNFETYLSSGYQGFDDGPFDFLSVMMYDQFSFTKNGKVTITRRDGTGYTMQYGTLSPGDIQIMATMYPAFNAGGR